MYAIEMLDAGDAGRAVDAGMTYKEALLKPLPAARPKLQWSEQTAYTGRTSMGKLCHCVSECLAWPTWYQRREVQVHALSINIALGCKLCFGG